MTNKVFSANMRALAGGHPNFSKMCRDIGLGRVQRRRYLDGQRWPQEEPLAKLCKFFEVDARILHIPLEVIKSDYFAFTLPPLTWKQVGSNLWTADCMGLKYSRTMIEGDAGPTHLIEVKGVAIYDGQDLNEGNEAARKDAEGLIALELLGTK